MIAQSEFARRRRQLMHMLGAEGIAIVPAAPPRIRNNDAYYPYRQDSDFHYLTGFAEPHAVLALVPGRAQGQEILFCQERDPERETWDGPRLGPEGAVRNLGMDDAFPIDDIDDILPGLIEGRSNVYYHFGRDPEFDLKVMQWVNRVRTQVKLGARAPHQLVTLGHHLHELRLFKSRAEVRCMARSAQIAAKAHRRAMQHTRPGCSEAEIEAELLHTFRSHHAVASYEPIVAAGANACILHYRANQAPLEAGDLLLIDAGAEYACYASDITRTFPINGRFSPQQRALYQVVLEAQKAAIEQVRTGHPWIAPHVAAVRAICKGLIRLGILKGSLESCIKDQRYKPYFMHKTGHWLGLDVHDVGDYRIDGEYRELEAGMVLTVEPGIYVPANAKGVEAHWRGIGIRIEDDVLVTKKGPQVLTEEAPKEADEIEHFMAQSAAARPR